jgi:hypothetical protein
VLGGRFGTGYNYGAVTTVTSTYPDKMKGKLKPAPPKALKPEDEPKH